MESALTARRRKLLDAWYAIEAKLQQRRVTPVSPRPFLEYAWHDFDVREVTSILASPAESYFGHKDILFAGLCAWVACPQKPILIQRAITLETAKQIHSAEEVARTMYQDIEQLGDIYVRVSQIGYEFFEDIYYPIGGIWQIANSPSVKGFRAMIQRGSSGTTYAQTLMSIFHYHLLHLTDRKLYNKASLNIASKLVFFILPEGNLRQRRVKEYWSWFKDSAAFSYSASRLMISEKYSLLDQILLGKATFRKHGHLIPQWFGQAAYAAEQILGNCAEKDTAVRALTLLPPVTAVPIAPPILDSRQRTHIKSKFRKKHATRAAPSPDTRSSD